MQGPPIARRRPRTDPRWVAKQRLRRLRWLRLRLPWSIVRPWRAAAASRWRSAGATATHRPPHRWRCATTGRREQQQQQAERADQLQRRRSTRRSPPSASAAAAAVAVRWSSSGATRPTAGEPRIACAVWACAEWARATATAAATAAAWRRRNERKRPLAERRTKTAGLKGGRSAETASRRNSGRGGISSDAHNQGSSTSGVRIVPHPSRELPVVVGVRAGRRRSRHVGFARIERRTRDRPFVSHALFERHPKRDQRKNGETKRAPSIITKPRNEIDKRQNEHGSERWVWLE